MSQKCQCLLMNIFVHHLLLEVSAADSSPSTGPAHADTDPWLPPVTHGGKREEAVSEGPNPPGLPRG